MSDTTTNSELDVFGSDAETWLEARREPRVATSDSDFVWGQGDFNVAVFHNLGFAEERALLDEAAAWQREKATAGYHAITWPTEWGGLDLSREHERRFNEREKRFATPTGHELFSVTTRLIAPTLRLLGTDYQRQEFVRPFLEAQEFCCQLFSEPGAGSDLANLSTRADRDGDEWVLNGQKVWSSGAQFAKWSLAVTRHDPDVAKHKGMTAFLVPLDAPGVDVRPIRQMSGGTSFNEVFLTDVRVPDALRVGEVGEGWKVGLTVLGFERGGSGGSSDNRHGGSWTQVLELARQLGLSDDPVIRQRLAEVFIHQRVLGMTRQRVAAATKAGEAPGPEGSIGKLFWVNGLGLISEVVSELLGPRLIADTGEWGTFEWQEHVLGAPGYRIAGGSDEIQRNIMGERVLGLPGEPRVDKGIPFKEIPR
jgi:alkylation response protein AidB-like acyl-CoA dehydrogenase